jgi:hypothetical protein
MKGTEAPCSGFEDLVEWQMRFDDRGLQDHVAEVFVNADIQIDETLHNRLILCDA